MAVNEIQFANFVCKFGDRPLRDLLSEVVLPAFTDDKLTRAAGEDTYFHFYEVRLATVRDHQVVYGRIIKNTQVGREQYFDPAKGIVKDPRQMSSSPSAFFVLIVENHRLIYYNETPSAPSLGAFAATARKFISDKHRAWIDKRFEDGKTARSNDPDVPRLTKKSMYIEAPRPMVEVIALSDPSDIEAFLDRYNRLRRVEFRIIATNDEMDAGELFQNIRDTFIGLHSTQTKLVSSNAKGLDVAEAKEITKEATRSGYQEVRLVGEDDHGNRLLGDNESFALRATLEDPPADDRRRAEVLVDRFDNLQQDGSITVQGDGNELPDEAKRLFDG